MNELKGQLFEVSTNMPLSNYTINAISIEENKEIVVLDTSTSDEQGGFTLSYTLPATSEENENSRVSNIAILQLIVLNKGGKEIHRVNVPDEEDERQSIIIHVSVSQNASQDKELTELISELQLDLPPDFLTKLAGKGIRTISDVRRTGRLHRIKDLDIPDDNPSIRTLEAHVNLSILPSDTITNSAIMDKGFTNLTSIAAATRTSFVSAVQGKVGAARATQLHEAAKAQTMYLDNVATEVAVMVANGYGMQQSNPLYEMTQMPESQQQSSKCSCEDCQSAISPLAYLADLLDYASKHLLVRIDMPGDSMVHLSSVTVKILTDLLCQPLGELPVNCLAMNRQLRQVRICIEVLRTYLNTTKPGDVQKKVLEQAEREYLLAAYTTLLTRLGTSFEELRLTRATGKNDSTLSKRRHAAANKLGIRSNKLDSLLLGGIVVNTAPPASGVLDVIHPWVVAMQGNLQKLFEAIDTDTPVLLNDSLGFQQQVLELTEEALEKLFGLEDTRKQNLSGILPAPKLQQWRQEYLRGQWFGQDFPSDPFQEEAGEIIKTADLLPVIDPDVTGPDDFRFPVAGQPAFDLWLKRRRLVDTLLSDFKAAREGTSLEKNWTDVLNRVFKNKYENLEELLLHLTEGGVSQKMDAKEQIEELDFTVESFSRVAMILAKVKPGRPFPGAEPVSDEEWQDVYAVLTQVEKHRLYPQWRQEEQAANISLGPALFWPPLQEPAEGTWPPVLTEQHPLIDPEFVKLDELPEPTAGKPARKFWQARRKQLDKTSLDLKEVYQAGGFSALLSKAFFDTEIPDRETADLEEIRRQLNDRDSRKAEEAKQVITNELHLSVESFTRLMLVKQKPAPAPSELAEIYAMLLSAYKEIQLYRTWIQEENAAGLTGNEYWKVRKARLPRWLAPAEVRWVWLQALATRSHSPLIDPDVISKEHLKTLSSKDEVYSNWSARRVWITGKLKTLHDEILNNSTSKLAGLDKAIESTISITAAELLALKEDRDNGNNISARLVQLTLSMNAFDRLMQIRMLAAAGADVLDSEWDNVCSILLQVEKQRRFAVWRETERNLKLTLSSDHFRLPDISSIRFPPPKPQELPAWRATWKNLHDWESILQSRMDQDQSVMNALREAVSATEEETLAALRDALVMATNAEGTTIRQKGKWITGKLLIDALNGSQQKTTRITQAIETIQGLLWSFRTGQLTGPLNNTYANLELYAPNFDEEWKWIGSYATWRSAMFVFLYPENILTPNLRTLKTPALSILKEKLQDNRRLTPQQARNSAETYSEYFKDVCNLNIEVTCQTDTITNNGTRKLFYMFARSNETNNVYWSVSDQAKKSIESQTFWETLPALNNAEKIVAAMPYMIKGGQRFIFLFALINVNYEQQLVFIQYNLRERYWENTTYPLQLPPGQKISKVLGVQKASEDTPELFIYTSYPYIRLINQEGDDWLTVNNNTTDEWGTYKFEIYAPFSIKEFHAITYNSASDGYTAYFTDSQGDLDYNEMYLITDGLEHAQIGINPNKLKEGLWIGLIQVKRENNSIAYDMVYAMTEEVIKIAIIYQVGHSHLYYDVYANSADKELSRIVVNHGATVYSDKQMLFYLRDNDSVAYCSNDWYQVFLGTSNEKRPKLNVKTKNAVNPQCQITPVTDLNTGSALQLYKSWIEFTYNENLVVSSNLIYIKEAFYFVPIYLALQLHASGQYITALDWFRTVYDYTAPLANRKIYYGLKTEEQYQESTERASDWLLDPLNPHQIAATRQNTYTRFTLLSIIRCLLDYADSEYTRDTAESVPRARLLYTTALELLDSDELRQRENECDQMILELDGFMQENPHGLYMENSTWEKIRGINDKALLGDTIDQVKALLSDIREPFEDWQTSAWEIIQEVTKETISPPVLSELVQGRTGKLSDAHTALLTQTAIAENTGTIGLTTSNNYLEEAGKPSDRSGHWQNWKVESSEMPADREPVLKQAYLINNFSGDVTGGQSGNTVSTGSVIVHETVHTSDVFIFPPFTEFCLPPNPVVKSLRLRAELNLYKLRMNRNIAGLERQLEPYAAATDSVSGMPVIGASGQLMLPGTITIKPTPYRYNTLIERAKQLIQLAAQIESAMLSAIEKKDAEYYNVLKAKQDIRVTQAGVQLQNLRVIEAENGVNLAELQLQRVQIQVTHYQELIAHGISELEQSVLNSLEEAAQYYTDAETSYRQAMTQPSSISINGPSFTPPALLEASIASAKASKSSTMSSILTTKASYERRAQDWAFQQGLAQQDITIAGQQITLAQDQVRVRGQEHLIAGIQAENAEDTLNFLNTKFTNAELYDWMSNILESVYRFFLQQATATAQLASGQLAFERQTTPPGFIQADYWEVPVEGATTSTSDPKTPDRRGLTGSARLLQDIYQLDQYAFETNKRKLQLTKTISLAQLDPYAFEQFRETGILPFSTSMELFDRSFPGHYLRLINRVRTTVIALIPPTDGINATLTTTGLSRVVIGGDQFQTIIVRRDPESVALSSPFSASGIFELDLQAEMLYPFESMGVDTSWEFRLLKAANRFDFRTIADVLLSFEYTALNSFDYRQQVISRLEANYSGDRAFSFRTQFADQWYDLHNPDQTASPFIVRFKTVREDFPPNLEELRIQQVLLYFIRVSGEIFEVPVSGFRFTEQGSANKAGGAAVSIDGVISTRRGNAGSWTAMIGKSPFGEWELTLPDNQQIRTWFDKDSIEDILFVITFSGLTPQWPI